MCVCVCVCVYVCMWLRQIMSEAYQSTKVAKTFNNLFGRQNKLITQFYSIDKSAKWHCGRHTPIKKT